MIHLRIEIHLTLLGPILTQSTNAGEFGIDAMMARDADKRPYLPYSLIRGKLRQALEELQDILPPNEASALAAFVARGFGPRADDEDGHDQRGTVFFSDFLHPTPKPVEKVLSRIQMDPKTGTAKNRMLMVIDAPFNHGEPAEFQGELRTVCRDYDEAIATVKFVRAGLGWLTHLGAERTVGFGRVESVGVAKIHITELASLGEESFRKAKETFESLTNASDKAAAVRRHPCQTAPAEGATAARYLIRIRPRALLCFGGNRKHSNIFESGLTIPGNALLGALATTYCMATGTKSNEVTPIAGRPWQALARSFGKLRFTHAFPTMRGSNQRPAVWPLSLAVAEPWSDDIPARLFDVALCPRPCMIPHDGGQRPPVFANDWKDHVVGEKLRKVFGWAKPRKELRVRTAIDPDKLRAEDEKLFAYEMIDPTHHDWLAVMDLSRIDEAERASVLGELRQLFAPGLGPLGKTKIDAEIELEPWEKLGEAKASMSDPIHDDLWVITLQTPAILCSRTDLAWSSNAPQEQLFKGYGRILTEISEGDLQLVRFFAKQSLSSVRFAGGRLPR